MSEASKIVYYIGAGASKDSVPMVSGFRDEVEKFNQFLKNYDSGNIYKSELDLEPLKKSTSNLLNKLANNFTVDTYAKKLFLTKQTEELNDYKNILSAFITRCQANNGIDRRYDFFLATITDLVSGEPILNPKIGIISWNYDSQFEIAYKGIFQDIQIDSIRNIMQIIFSGKPMIFSQNVEKRVDVEKFCIIKLNGNASYRHAGGHSLFEDSLLSSQGQADLELLPKIAQVFNDLEKNGGMFDNLNFSWEDNKPGFSGEIMPRAIDLCKKAKALVVIGYSFPTFNRNIDSILLNSMKNLERIYVQVKKEDYEGVKYSILSLMGKIKSNESFVTFVENTDSFHVPFELDGEPNMKGRVETF